MKTKQLPANWKILELSEICDVRDGTHDSPKYVNEGYPLITSKNLSKGYIDFSETNLIIKEDFDNINKRSKVDVGDIIMPMIGTIGNPIIVPETEEFAIKNVALIKFNNEIILNTFVKLFLSSSYFNRWVDSIHRGGTQKFISLKDIRSIKIPLPQLLTQKKIVKILEQAEQLKQKREQADKLMDDYLKSVFNEMFLKKSFPEEELEKVTEIIMGQSPPGDSYNEISNGIPFFQGKAEFTEKYAKVKKYTTNPSKIAEKESILMSVRAPVGDVNLCPIKSCIGRGLASIIPKEKLELSYLYNFLKLNKEKIANLGSGSTFKAITSKQLKTIKIPVPDKTLQQTFAQIVEKVEKIKQAQKKSKQEIEDLFNALMQKAFRGEIR